MGSINRHEGEKILIYDFAKVQSRRGSQEYVGDVFRDFSGIRPRSKEFTGIRSYGLGDTKFHLYYFSKVLPTRKKCSKMRHSKGITISSRSKYDICMRFEREQIRGI